MPKVYIHIQITKIGIERHFPLIVKKDSITHTNKNVKLVVGLAAYRAADGEMENEPQVLSKQISYFKNQGTKS